MKARNVIIYIGAFLFINVIGIYVQGGFYNQTVEGKAITQFFATIFALSVTAVDVAMITYKQIQSKESNN